MNKQDKEIYGLLIKLKELGELFNQMVGDLYTGDIADQMNRIIYLEHKHKIIIKWIQPLRRISFLNLNELIEKYEKKERAFRKGNRKHKATTGTV